MPTESRSLPAGTPVPFTNGTTVTLPFGGQAVQWVTPPGELRAARVPAEEDPAWLVSALTDPDLGIREQETVQVDAAAPQAAARLLRAAPVADTVQVSPAPPPPGTVQVILYQDESGGVSWHLPDGAPEEAAAAFARGETAAVRAAQPRLRAATGARSTFTIPTRTAAAQEALRSGPALAPVPGLRSAATRLGRKIFRVFLLPLLGNLAEDLVARIVGTIERKYRQTLIRPLTKDNYKTRVLSPFTDWASFRGQRSLLVIHGIFSSTEGVLSRLDQDAVVRWQAHYGGRMIAYDHLTVTQSPEDNATVFLQELAHDGGDFEFDILCHSRGGIVARTLAERARELVPEARCAVKNVFFVATPNQGSQLGDAGHMVEMIDVFTNLLNYLPNGPLLYSMEILLSLVKLLAYGFEKLPGVVSMGTEGYIPDVLNRSAQSSPATYAAAAANYSPKPGDLFFTIASSVLDRVFTDRQSHEIANDLVVPTDGVFAANGHPSFPIADPLVYQPAEALWHTELFGQDRTVERIERLFGIAAGPAAVAPAAPAGTVRLPRPGLREMARGGVTMADIGGSGFFPAPPATPALPAMELRRDPFLDFHELVREGEANDLVVRLEEVQGGRDALLAIALAAGQESARITVTLSAPGFDVAPAREQELTVSRERDPQTERAVFRLTARRPGDAPATREIRADFWLGNSCIGSVTHETTVVPAGYAGSPAGAGGGTVSPFAVPRVPRKDCDLIVRVEGRDESGKPPFSIRLRSEIPGYEVDGLYVGELDLPGDDLSTYFNTFLEKQFQSYPRDPRLSDADFAAAEKSWSSKFTGALNDFGRDLWSMLPQDFRAEYFKYYVAGVAPRSILIHSDETVFPWELVIPWATVGDEPVALQPLGVEHVLGRWRPGLRMMPSPQSVTVQGFCVLNPSYPPPGDLPWSAEEIRRLRGIVPNLTVAQPADLATVRGQVLQRSDIQILHFSGHGDYDPRFADLNSILLEDGAFEAFRLQGTPLGLKGHPILYLNACSAGKSGVAVGRMGGFAAKCLSSGCSGIIAPYWPINDARAADFSCALYTKLNQGRAVGEALQELRQENLDDPTFRAYAYLGDPWARPVFPL
jgi:hypothetical protein